MAKRTTTNTKTRVMVEDAPWRALPPEKEEAFALFPKVSSGGGSHPHPHRLPPPHLCSIEENPTSQYALTSVLKQSDPIGEGWATEARLEAAGPDCLIPGLVRPLRLLGLQVWPMNVDLKFMEPVGRQLRALSRFMDSWVNLMNASFQER